MNPYKHPHFILSRQGISNTIRTSTFCRLWGTDHFTEISECPPTTKQDTTSFRFRCGSFHGQAATQIDAIKAVETHLATVLEEPATFYPFIESYGSKAIGTDQHFVFCHYEEATATIRLHRSNVCLASFVNDGKTTCDGTPVLFDYDAANVAYRPLIASVIGHVIGQNCRGNDRLWITWLLSQYIHYNAIGRFIHNEPRFDGWPTFPHDLVPSIQLHLKSK